MPFPSSIHYFVSIILLGCWWIKSPLKSYLVMCEFKAECPLLVLTEHIAKPCYGACAKAVKKTPFLQVLWEWILGRLDWVYCNVGVQQSGRSCAFCWEALSICYPKQPRMAENVQNCVLEQLLGQGCWHPSRERWLFLAVSILCSHFSFCFSPVWFPLKATKITSQSMSFCIS